MEKRNKTVQIRISNKERKMINALYENIEEFNLSSFVRKCLIDCCKENNINTDTGIGFMKIG